MSYRRRCRVKVHGLDFVVLEWDLDLDLDLIWSCIFFHLFY